MATEAQRRANAKYRQQNRDACRERVNAANKKRYDNDETFRQKCILKSTLRQNCLKEKYLKTSNGSQDSKSKVHTLEHYLTVTTQTKA